jgi:uncharacterized repeat protein (TIGR01451 family)
LLPPLASSAAATATVGSTTPDPVPGNNTASSNAAVATADLAVGISSAPTPAIAGSPITYTVVVTNLGPGVANSVLVSVTLSAGATFISASGTGWTCTNLSGVVMCSLPLLAVTTAAPITIVAQLPADATSALATAHVGSAAPDLSSANNTATVNPPVNPATFTVFIPQVGFPPL